MHDLLKEVTTATTRVKAFINLKRHAEEMLENVLTKINILFKKERIL